MKKCLFGTCTDGLFTEASLAVLRIFTGLAMALTHGMKKVPPAEKFIAGVAEMGLPMPTFFAWSAGLAEFAGGLLLALGLLTRPSALLISVTMLAAAFLRHGSDPFNVMEMALLYLTIGLVFTARGGGRFSLDFLIAEKLFKK